MIRARADVESDILFIRVDSTVFELTNSRVRHVNVRAGGGDDLVVFSSTVGQTTTIAGGEGNDSIVGSQQNDKILGGPGHDRIRGEAGNDRIAGDAGNDRINGGKGDDATAGGVGNDALSGGDGNDNILGDDLREDDASDNSFVVNGFNAVGNAAGRGAGPDGIESEDSPSLVEARSRPDLTI